MSPNVGYHHTKEARDKIRQAGMGRIFTKEVKAKISKSHIGKTHTEETKAKLRQLNLGKYISEETKYRMSLAQNGRVCSKETRTKISRSRMGIIFTEEHKSNLSLAQKGRICTEGTRAKMSLARLGNKYSLGCHHTDKTRNKLSELSKIQWENPEIRAKMSLAQKGRKHTEETKVKMSQSKMGVFPTEETRAKMSKVARVNRIKDWQDMEFKNKRVKAMRLGCCIHPNKPETVLLGLLEKAYPSEWKFVGDGELIIAGKNPDFVNVNGKKMIVELFGDYWHLGENSQDRIDLFKGYGFKTLVIWESELGDTNKVLERIAEFVEYK